MFNKDMIIAIQSKLVDSVLRTCTRTRLPRQTVRLGLCNVIVCTGCTKSINARAFMRVVRVCSQKPAHARASAVELAVACVRPNRATRFSSGVLLVRSYLLVTIA